MSLSTKKIDSAWKKLDMVIKDTKDRHAQFRWPDPKKGKLIIATKRSLGSGKLDGNIPHMIRQQMQLNQGQFDDLIACPLKRDGYAEILKEKRRII